MSNQKPGPEELCQELLGRVRTLHESKATFTAIMKDLAEFIKAKKIRINIVQKKGARPQAVEGDFLNISSTDACSSLREILENGDLPADQRLAAIVRLVKGSTGTTRKNGSKTNATRKESNSAKTPPQPFDPAQPQNRTLEHLNTVVGQTLDAVYKKEDEANPLIKKGYPGKILPNPTIFECEAFAFSLESLNADGKNSDCFIHSFLLATCPNFRAAKVKSTAYLEYATAFRTKILPRIVEFVFSQPDFVPESPEFNAEAIKEDLTTASEFLSDDLIKAVCYYYSISMLIIGPGTPRVSRVMYPKAEQAGTYPSAYVITNAGGTHWEPARIVGTHGYLLEPDQVECITSVYSGAEKLEKNSNEMERERAFKELDRIKLMPKEEIAAYIAIKQNEPGQITALFIEGNERVIALEVLKDRVAANYKEKGFGMNPRAAKVSDDLFEDIKDEQIKELNQDPEDPVDMAGITARVEAFLAPKAVAKGRVLVKKKGGFRTRRKGRA